MNLKTAAPSPSPSLDNTAIALNPIEAIRDFVDQTGREIKRTADAVLHGLNRLESAKQGEPLSVKVNGKEYTVTLTQPATGYPPSATEMVVDGPGMGGTRFQQAAWRDGKSGEVWGGEKVQDKELLKKVLKALSDEVYGRLP